MERPICVDCGTSYRQNDNNYGLCDSCYEKAWLKTHGDECTITDDDLFDLLDEEDYEDND